MQRIVVGVDGSDRSSAALRWALEEAVMRKATVEIVHAWQYSTMYAGLATFDAGEYEVSAKALLEEVLSEVDTIGVAVPVEHRLVMDLPASALIEAGKGADLLVLGSRGRGGFTGLLLGSVSQQVAHHAPCPLVIVPETAASVTPTKETSR